MHETIHKAIEWAVLLIELLAVTIIVAGVLLVVLRRGTVRYLIKVRTSAEYESYRHQLGKPLLLGMEMLVAADAIKTVTLEPTLNNILMLGLLMILRTLLSWSMVVEIEGHWPWQGSRVKLNEGESDGPTPSG